MTLPTIQGDAANAAIEALALDHPRLAHHIRNLGAAFLRLGAGLRDGQDGASKTYDLSFVDGRRSFACLTATPGKHDTATKGRLQVQVRHRGDRLRFFKRKSMPSEVAQGWYSTQLAGEDDIDALLDGLLIARPD